MDSLLMTCKQCWWCNTLRSKTRPEKSQYIATASQVSDLCYQTFIAVSFTKECYITNLFAFCLETTKSIFVNPIALNIFHAILSYFIFLDFTRALCCEWSLWWKSVDWGNCQLGFRFMFRHLSGRKLLCGMLYPQLGWHFAQRLPLLFL